MTWRRNDGQRMDKGYIYAPYIPLQVTPTIIDFPAPRTKKTPLQSLVEEVFEEEIKEGKTRPIWGRKVCKRFFGKITVENIG